MKLQENMEFGMIEENMEFLQASMMECFCKNSLRLKKSQTNVKNFADHFEAIYTLI